MKVPNGTKLESILRANTRIVAWAIMLVLLADVMVAIRGGFSTDEPRSKDQAAQAGNTPSSLPTIDPTTGANVLPTASASPGSQALPSAGKTLAGKPGTVVPGYGTIPFGVTKDTIRIVYYWKGDRTMSSAFLPPGQNSAVDEANAFHAFVEYVNKYAKGGTLMGFPFNLHGRKLVYDVYDAGQYPETFGATAENIKEKPPFAAISSHGGLSDYICDYLYQAKIFNISTYDLGRYPGGLYKGTNGYCLPQGLAWEGQETLSVSYITKQSKTSMYQSATGPKERVYGILYADYPGLKQSVARLEKKLKAAGVNVAAVYQLPTSLADAGPQAPNAVARFRGKQVNTIIAPDAGAPITFTHAAQANGYYPDYFIWPCSGQDAVGQVRLYDPGQWGRAEGLSCYDENWNLDLTLDSNARKTEWYRQYQEVAGTSSDPPSSSPLVYHSFLPLLAGITNAGRELTVERFRAGMQALRYPKGQVRYHAINGPTSDPSHFMVVLNSADGSQIGDVARVRWSNTVRSPGNASTGNYVYSEERYRPGKVF